MKVYIHIDGDNVGNNIEILLMDGRLDDAVHLSKKIKTTFDKIKEKIELELTAEVHIYAGDDLIVSTEKHCILEDLKKICDVFNDSTGLTLSIGVGNDIKESLSNLRRAKISGRNKIIGLNDE